MSFIKVSRSHQESIQDAYDSIGEQYECRRSPHDADVAFCERVLKNIPPGGLILDIGCGAAGQLLTRIAPFFHVIGVDISKRQITRAVKKFPSMTFIASDILETDLSDSILDAAIAHYVLFHIPRDQHRALFRKLYTWIKIGGWLSISASIEDCPGEYRQLLGSSMYYSSYNVQTTLSMLRDEGFQIHECISLPSHINPMHHHAFISAYKGRRPP